MYRILYRLMIWQVGFVIFVACGGYVGWFCDFLRCVTVWNAPTPYSVFKLIKGGVRGVERRGGGGGGKTSMREKNSCKPVG
jgi:hypothetical protein